MNVWLPRGKKIKPTDLMPNRSEIPAFLDAESFRRYMRERIAKAKKEGRNG